MPSPSPALAPRPAAMKSMSLSHMDCYLISSLEFAQRIDWSAI